MDVRAKQALNEFWILLVGLRSRCRGKSVHACLELIINRIKCVCCTFFRFFCVYIFACFLFLFCFFSSFPCDVYIYCSYLQYLRDSSDAVEEGNRKENIAMLLAKASSFDRDIQQDPVAAASSVNVAAAAGASAAALVPQESMDEDVSAASPSSTSSSASSSSSPGLVYLFLFL